MSLIFSGNDVFSDVDLKKSGKLYSIQKGVKIRRGTSKSDKSLNLLFTGDLHRIFQAGRFYS